MSWRVGLPCEVAYSYWYYHDDGEGEVDAAIPGYGRTTGEEEEEVEVGFRDGAG